MELDFLVHIQKGLRWGWYTVWRCRRSKGASGVSIRKGPARIAPKQGVFFHQREHDVVQIGVAGENIGFAQVNGTSAGFDMELLGRTHWKGDIF